MLYGALADEAVDVAFADGDLGAELRGEHVALQAGEQATVGHDMIDGAVEEVGLPVQQAQMAAAAAMSGVMAGVHSVAAAQMRDAEEARSQPVLERLRAKLVQRAD